MAPAVGVAVVVWAAIVVIGRVIVAHPGWSQHEDSLLSAVHRTVDPAFTALAHGVNLVFGPVGAVLVVVAVEAAVLVWSRSVRVFVRAGLLIVVPWAVAEITKSIVRRPRPEPAFERMVAHPRSFSFPSGHTAFAASLCCAIVLILGAGVARRVAIAVGVVVVVVTAWSRVYLAVHYPSDVVASMVLIPVVALAVDRVLGSMRFFEAQGRATSRRVSAG